MSRDYTKTPLFRSALLFTVLSLLCIIFFVGDIVLGSFNITWEQFWNPQDLDYRKIIIHIRLPKALTACVIGAAVSLAGLIMQTMFNNPLAGPYVLGVSSGASLGVAAFLLAGSFLPTALTNHAWGLVFAAIVGAAAILLLVLGISFKIRNMVSLLIAGIMFGQITSAIVSILQNYSNPEQLKLFVVWTFGSLFAVTWEQMWVLLPLVAMGMIIVVALQKSLNGLLIGENYAQCLGVRIRKIRFWIILAVALLAGATTAFTGPIAFIGVAVPHIVRGLFKTSNHRITVPGVILCGAALLMLCDIACQLPAEGYTLPINAVSSLVGGPVIIWIILKNRKR
jgi:iron complex transport system permease protein